jgi:hypothetical protein
VKTAMVASAAIMAIGFLIAGCAQSEGSAREEYRTTQPTVSIQRATSEELMDEAARAANLVIGNKIMEGMADGSELRAALQQIEEARQALAQLDEAQRATCVGGGLNIMIGVGDSSQLAEDLQSIETARQEVLARICLVH